MRCGNPFFWKPVLAGTACTGYGLPRPLRGLAMTDVVDGLRPGFDFLCHCEEAKPTWQSLGTNGREISTERYFPEIATAPLGPRNDRLGSAYPQACHCEEAAGRRGNLKALMDGRLRLNETSRRLPRLLRSLAMTAGGGGAAKKSPAEDFSAGERTQSFWEYLL